MLGHHSSSKDVQPALNSSSGSFRDGALAESGVLGLWGVLLSFLALLLGCKLGSDSLDERFVLTLPSVLGLHSGLIEDCKLLLRLRPLMRTENLCRAAQVPPHVIVCMSEDKYIV